MNTHKGQHFSRILRGGVAFCLLLLLSSCSDSGPLTHTVTFDPNGGRLRGEAIVSVIDGELLEEPEDPYRPGYRFTRWYADEARTTIFDFKIPIMDSITLYAGWSYITPDDPDVPASVGEPDIGIWTPGDGNSVDMEM